MHAKLKIGKLVVIGTGLVGGSFALALKRARAVRRVVGVGRTRRNLAAALKLRIIDEASQDPARAVRDADLVLLAMPVGQMAAVMAAIAPHLPPHAVVTDAGSTKCDVIAAAAFAELFRERNVILAPLRETTAAATRLVRRAWETCGARVVKLDAAEHDAILAGVSHLPHIVAYALVNMLARRPNAPRLFGLSAGGLRDTVRIAGSSPEMWSDICVANRDALLAALEDYENELEQMRAAIEGADAAELKRMFAQARNAREKWLVKKQR